MSIFKLLFLFSLKSNYIVSMEKYFMNFAFKCHTCQKTANRNFFLLNWPPSGFLKFQAKKRSPQPTQEEQLRNQKNWVNTVISLFKMGPQNVFQAISPCKFLAFGQLSYGLPLLLQKKKNFSTLTIELWWNGTLLQNDSKKVGNMTLIPHIVPTRNLHSFWNHRTRWV